MIVAGIDIGNTTTEIVLGEVTPQTVTPLTARRARTTGSKGSAASVAGAARLVMSAEKALGRRAELLLLPPLHPVVTLSASLPSPPRAAAPLRRLDDPCASTPAGSGFAVGAHRPLRELATLAATREPLIVSVPAGTDFEDAAATIAAAQTARLPIVGAVVAGDDAVLIANRIPQAIPIVDETDLGGLRTGELIAVEVAAPGGRVQVAGDPVALVAAFGLAPRRGRLARRSGHEPRGRPLRRSCARPRGRVRSGERRLRMARVRRGGRRGPRPPFPRTRGARRLHSARLRAPGPRAQWHAPPRRARSRRSTGP